jgi:hypothetical protein
VQFGQVRKIKWVGLFAFVFIYLFLYGRTPVIQMNLDGEASGYAENPANWIFL